MKPEQDSSLQASSLRRALAGEPPNTLTPYEWLEWYRQHGQPAAHRVNRQRPRRLWYKLFKRPSPANTRDDPG
ncbi:hypothetical protein E2F43_08855 [Seongchinamella unica]|uniref:Uncharacterized protein n=1 Tax=Seongchinamella unica TaxID=2547392 RepID=A0A4R5LRV3_9GAMM|nr:hypothetical protein [Seongchinamella unica]TDG13625.1 hypothetical protein E2F43_08855 [Seongchinamella unica]